MEVSDDHRTWLSGPDTGQEPRSGSGDLRDRLLTPLIWFAAHHVLRVTNPLGRKVRDHFLDPPRGIPLARVRRKEIVEAGIERVPRTVGVDDGAPVVEDGRVLDVRNVIWCTGFRADYGWIDLPIFGKYGFPETYLVVFGSVVTYGAYVWLLGRVGPARLSTHGYVNPAVAVAVGALLGGERVTVTLIVAMTLILGAVAMLVRPERPTAGRRQIDGGPVGSPSRRRWPVSGAECLGECDASPRIRLERSIPVARANAEGSSAVS